MSPKENQELGETLSPSEMTGEDTVSINEAISDLNSTKEHDERSLSGTVIAQKYEILDLIGAGGMSEVYRARNISLDKIVAVKALHLQRSKDDISLRRFKQEAQAASTLTHAGIVSVYDYGECEDGTPYLVMDLLEGETLSSIIKTGSLSLERFLSIMIQVTAALTHAHQHGVVHRDLKPSNIMISLSGEKELARIVDFGIAKILTQSSPQGQQLTQTGEIFGSPLYMSPEQCTGAGVDQRADIYSLGCLMYEALSGKVPYLGESVFETIHKHINEPPPPLHAPQIPEETRKKLEIIILRCLAKSPTDRFQSCAQIESELEALSINVKVGFLNTIGGAWNLAAAKRRAAKKSRLPLLLLALIGSFGSGAALLYGLHSLQDDFASLENSRGIINQISLAESDFLLLAEATRNYFGAVMFHPDDEESEKRMFENRAAVSKRRLDELDRILANDPYWQKAFSARAKERLMAVPDVASVSARQMERAAGMGAPMSRSSIATAHHLSNVCTEATHVLQLMARSARKREQIQIRTFRKTQSRVNMLSLICVGINSVVVVLALVFFAKGSPERLRKLAQNAARLSKQHGIKSETDEEDELADLDNVLNELASALSQAEEREKILLKRLESNSPEQ
ncbi:MAG: serine/threonine protein kinase [Candidatus Obscuribacterales bacterium]|nr:serine/threonine protein kinase [Candidatus Obscuribacterales bacterium]